MSAPRSRSAGDDGFQPKSMTRGKVWSEEVEEAYRFQLAGYRDAIEYTSVQQGAEVSTLFWGSIPTQRRLSDLCYQAKAF